MTDDETQPDPQDARYSFWPAQYVTLPLLVYDNTSMDAVDCAIIASNPQTNLTDAVFQVLDTISKYLRYISDTAQCADINQLALWNNDSGTPTIVCQCAPGKVCNLGNDNLDTLLAVVGILTLIAALGLLVFQGVTSPMSLVEARRLRKWDRSQRQEDLPEEQEDVENNASLFASPLKTEDMHKSVELQTILVQPPATLKYNKNKNNREQQDTRTGGALLASSLYFDA